MTEQPVAKLQIPVESDPIPNLVELVTNGNGFSLTYGINMTIATFTSWDPLTTIVNELAGDWEELQRSSQSVYNLAQYNEALASTIDLATATVRGEWEGNASDSARDYFSSISGVLAQQVETLRTIAGEIQKFASASYNLAALAAGAVQEAVDIAISLAALAVASLVGKGSGVGAPASLGLDAVIAVQVIRLVAACKTIVGFLSKINTAVQGAAGIVEAMTAELNSGKLVELPESGYSHPGVNV